VIFAGLTNGQATAESRDSESSRKFSANIVDVLAALLLLSIHDVQE